MTTAKPGMKRVIIAITVAEDFDKSDISVVAEMHLHGEDATTWEWADFWQDVADDQIGPDHDYTSEENNA